jgi:hypothetical protein
MDDIFWGCTSRQAGVESVALLAAHLADERALSRGCASRARQRGRSSAVFVSGRASFLPAGASWRAFAPRCSGSNVSRRPAGCRRPTCSAPANSRWRRSTAARASVSGSGCWRRSSFRYSGAGMSVTVKESHSHRARRLVEQRGQEPSLRLPQREAPRQPQRELGVSLCPELDGANGMDLPRTMDQTRRPAGTACRAGEPQGARGAGRRERPMPAPTAPRVAASVCHRPAR